MLCLPLNHQGQLVGLLYLENRLTQDAFTPQRLEILRMLAGQAAISISNAMLWRELEAKERQLTQFLDAVPVGIFITDADGVPYYTNDAARSIMGQGVAPETSRERLSEVYQAYVSGTDQLSIQTNGCRFFRPSKDGT